MADASRCRGIACLLLALGACEASVHQDASDAGSPEPVSQEEEGDCSEQHLSYAVLDEKARPVAFQDETTLDLTGTVLAIGAGLPQIEGLTAMAYPADAEWKFMRLSLGKEAMIRTVVLRDTAGFGVRVGSTVRFKLRQRSVGGWTLPPFTLAIFVDDQLALYLADERKLEDFAPPGGIEIRKHAELSRSANSLSPGVVYSLQLTAANGDSVVIEPGQKRQFSDYMACVQDARYWAAELGGGVADAQADTTTVRLVRRNALSSRKR